MHSDFSKIENKLTKIFNIKPKNPTLFEKALTHSSYTKENNINSLESYERLEFLGDAVLKLCISKILYEKYPNYHEGDLTKIRSIVVSDNTLAQLSAKIGLDKLMILGQHEEKMGGRDKKSIQACAFEAVLGAYYLEGEFESLQEFLKISLESYILDVDGNFEKFNAKAILQEYTQSQDKKTPIYSIKEEKGPSHNKVFVVEVSYNENVLAVAEGKTKKQAEQNCALLACKKLGVIK